MHCRRLNLQNLCHKCNIPFLNYDEKTAFSFACLRLSQASESGSAPIVNETGFLFSTIGLNAEAMKPGSIGPCAGTKAGVVDFLKANDCAFGLVIY